MKKLRLGLFDSLESRPLVWSFLKGHYSDVFVPSSHRPAQMGELLDRRQLDVALVPSIELARIGDLAVLPDLCLAWRGDSLRVLVVSPVPLREVRRVAVSADIEWASVLMQVVLAQRFALRPEVVQEPRRTSGRAGSRQAVLVAGQGAMDTPAEGEVVDVGAAWEELSGLPFVAAVWAVRPGVELPELPFYFKSALRYGLRSIDHLVRETAAEQGFDAEAARRYLEEDLRFVLGRVEEAGLADLLCRAHREGLCQSDCAIRLWGEERALG